VRQFGIEPGDYAPLISRADEIVSAFVTHEEEATSLPVFMHVLGAYPDKGPPWAYGGIPGVEKALEYLAANHAVDKKEYKLRFLPKDSKDARTLDMGDFVSRLFVRSVPTNCKPGVLWIVYDRKMIAEQYLSVRAKGFFRGGLAVPEKRRCLYRLFTLCLAKICLHEGAHIAHHLDYLINELRAGKCPVCTARQENEAWFGALYVWSKLVGDAAEHFRMPPRKDTTDKAWLIA